MPTIILITAVIALLAVLSHRRSRLENKIYKHIPLSDWIIILVLPLFFYLCWVLFVQNILSRPEALILPLDDLDILSVAILFLVGGFVGNSLHFTGKILWRYLANTPQSMAYKVNEMFHGRLSHYLSYLNFLLTMFILPVLEINHPLVAPANFGYLLIITLSGMVLGYSSSRAVFYTHQWFGGYFKPLFFLIFLVVAILINIFKFYHLKIAFYPVSLFFIVSFLACLFVFLARQSFIFARLSAKRRLRFLAKILSA